MGNLLITKTAPYQVYLANWLFRKKIITQVLVEEGASHFSEKKAWKRILTNKKKALLIARALQKDPRLFFSYIKLLFRKKTYFGNMEKHNKNILKKDYTSFASGLKIITTKNINDPKWLSLYKTKRKFVFVFGTRLIKPECFAKTNALWINLHWGWSPNYRVEGIVSALANQGPQALGITVHFISEVPDGGHILARRKVKTDKSDNFYSIGLKMTKAGFYLIKKIARQKTSQIKEIARPQNLKSGQVTPVSQLLQNPDLFHLAWGNLKNGTTA